MIVGGVGGADAVIIGARDTRTAKIAGNLKPGDTVVHSTGPKQAAQLQLKEDKRQAMLVTKGSDGKQAMLLLDGKNDKVTIAAFGFVIDISKSSGTMSLMSPNGQNGIVISDSGTRIMGQIVHNLGGPLSLAAGTAANIGAVGLVPVPGVFVGT